MLEHLKGQYVSLAMWNRDGESAWEEIGGGINSGSPREVIILLDMDEYWVTFLWEHSGQIVAVHAGDVVCIATDLPRKKEEAVGSSQIL